MVTAFDHLHIYASDPERTVAFYVTHFGAERTGAIAASEGRSNRVIIVGGQYIVISEFPPGAGPAEPPNVGDGAFTHGFGVAHLGLNVDDLDTMIDRLRAAGVDVHSGARDGGKVRYVYLTAPDGVIVELTEYVLPARLRPAVAALRALNRAIHVTRRTIARRML